MDRNIVYRIKNDKDLYKLLPKEFRKDFSIGMHGFDGGGRYWEQDENGEYKLNQNKINETKNNILENGLKFPSERMLLSTVSFNNLSSYISAKGVYGAGGIIIALPKVLRNETGDEIFLGTPNEESMSQQLWDRNTNPTSLSEIILPEEGSLDSMFVLGTYTKDDEGIKVCPNPNHIAYNKGIVSNEYFKTKQNKLSELIRDGKIDTFLINEANNQKKNKPVSLMELGKKSYQHFGSRISEKLNEAIKVLKSKFLSKDKSEDKSEDLTNER